MKLDFDTTRFEKCPRKYEYTYPRPTIDPVLTCLHGTASGRPCRSCGDVVPTLTGKRPWWTFLWRFWNRWMLYA